MERIFFLFSLRPGVTPERYSQFWREADRPYISSLPFVRDCHASIVRGAPLGTFPYSVIETIDTDSWEAWERTYDDPGGRKLFDYWAQHLGDLGTLTRVVTEPIDPA
jgi:hypothetical protein